MRLEKKLMIYLMKKVSNIGWNILDNLSWKLERIAQIYDEDIISDEYIRECKAFGLKKQDKILHIGCGPFPLSVITLAKATGGKVVGIDRSKRAVKAAKEIVQKLDINDRIEIILANGADIPIDNFNVIIISACSEPMVQIAKNVFENAKKDSKIIVREVSTAIEPIKNLIVSREDIIVVKKIKHNPFPFVEPFGWQSFYLKKN